MSFGSALTHYNNIGRDSTVSINVTHLSGPPSMFPPISIPVKSQSHPPETMDLYVKAKIMYLNSIIKSKIDSFKTKNQQDKLMIEILKNISTSLEIWEIDSINCSSLAEFPSVKGIVRYISLLK